LTSPSRLRLAPGRQRRPHTAPLARAWPSRRCSTPPAAPPAGAPPEPLPGNRRPPLKACLSDTPPRRPSPSASTCTTNPITQHCSPPRIPAAALPEGVNGEIFPSPPPLLKLPELEKSPAEPPFPTYKKGPAAPQAASHLHSDLTPFPELYSAAAP
jgi:hypothetical protein